MSEAAVVRWRTISSVKRPPVPATTLTLRAAGDAPRRLSGQPAMRRDAEEVP